MSNDFKNTLTILREWFETHSSVKNWSVCKSWILNEHSVTLDFPSRIKTGYEYFYHFKVHVRNKHFFLLSNLFYFIINCRQAELYSWEILSQSPKIQRLKVLSVPHLYYNVRWIPSLTIILAVSTFQFPPSTFTIFWFSFLFLSQKLPYSLLST